MSMEKELDILSSGACVYSEGMMPRFYNWAKESVPKKYRELALFYVAEIGSMNSKGASSRKLWISKEEQVGILQKYLSLN